MGAWIETCSDPYTVSTSKVAPLVGAWIETVTDMIGTGVDASHPSWVRGLKLAYHKVVNDFYRRTPRGCVD